MAKAKRLFAAMLTAVIVMGAMVVPVTVEAAGINDSAATASYSDSYSESDDGGLTRNELAVLSENQIKSLEASAETEINGNFIYTYASLESIIGTPYTAILDINVAPGGNDHQDVVIPDQIGGKSVAVFFAGEQFNEADIRSLTVGYGINIAYNTVISNPYIESVDIREARLQGNSDTKAEDGFELNCENLRSVAWSSFAPVIPNDCFYGCEQLHNITNTENVKVVREGAFLFTGIGYAGTFVLDLPSCTNFEDTFVHSSGITDMTIGTIGATDPLYTVSSIFNSGYRYRNLTIGSNNIILTDSPYHNELLNLVLSDKAGITIKTPDKTYTKSSSFLNSMTSNGYDHIEDAYKWTKIASTDKTSTYTYVGKYFMGVVEPSVTPWDYTYAYYTSNFNDRELSYGPLLRANSPDKTIAAEAKEQIQDMKTNPTSYFYTTKDLKTSVVNGIRYEYVVKSDQAHIVKAFIDSNPAYHITTYSSPTYINGYKVAYFASESLSNLNAASIVINGSVKLAPGFMRNNTYVKSFSGKNIVFTKYGLFKKSVVMYGGAGYEAFKDCTSLESVILPDNITVLGDSCFWGCKSLKTVSNIGSVKTIGDMCFYEALSAKASFTLTNIEKIGYMAFAESGISQVDIPYNANKNKTRVTVGNCAFENCNNIKFFRVGRKLVTFGTNSLDSRIKVLDIRSTTSCVIPAQALSVSDSDVKTMLVYGNLASVKKFASENKLECYDLVAVDATVTASETNTNKIAKVELAGKGGTGKYKYKVSYRDSKSGSWKTALAWTGSLLSNTAHKKVSIDLGNKNETYQVKVYIMDANGVQTNKTYTV